MLPPRTADARPRRRQGGAPGRAWAFVLVAAAGAALLACGEEGDQPIGSAGARPEALVIGDSIAWQGWGTFEFESARLRLLDENATSSDYTLEHLARWLAEGGSPEIILWNNGLWDIQRGIELPEYRANLVRIAERLEQTGAKIFFVTTTPQTGFEVTVSAYNGAAQRALAGRGIEFIDLYSFASQELPEAARPDGTHWTAEAAQLQAAFIDGELGRLLSEGAGR
jgi:lysophospholipase L1-like esterase